MTDISLDLQKTIRAAFDDEASLNLVGGNSKAFYGREIQGESLDVAKNQGVINYEPTELVVSVRNGTRLSELESILSEQNQMLGFEPPCFESQSTIGGAVAAGLSGPRRPFSGAVRDHILGCKIINGHADILSFGGTAMKNVAGYDLSRLMAGSMGTLGLILEVSLKVIPKPEIESTWSMEISKQKVIEMMAKLLQKSLPLTGLYHDGERLFYRLSGSTDSINSVVDTLGGEECTEQTQLWSGLNDQSSEFFQDESPLWRISVAPATEQFALAGQSLLDWGGALRWLKSEESAQQIYQTVAEAGGHATLFRGAKRDGQVFQPLPPDLMQIQERLKLAFDPKGIFNPGRMYSEF